MGCRDALGARGAGELSEFRVLAVAERGLRSVADDVVEPELRVLAGLADREGDDLLALVELVADHLGGVDVESCAKKGMDR